MNILDESCSVCGRPFTERAWENRHTDPRDNLGECHASCCPRCHGNGAINRANKVKPILEHYAGTPELPGMEAT